MIDVLGFRAIVKQHGFDDVARYLHHFFHMRPRRMESVWWTSDSSKKEQQGIARCGSTHFSDTLLLWSDPVHDDMTHIGAVEGAFFTGISHLLFFAFLADFPLRGGIAFGPIHIDTRKRIYVGQPIIDAHETEAAQNWIGVALHPNCKRPGRGTTYEILRQYAVPVKNALSLNHALDWTALAHLPKFIREQENLPDYRKMLFAKLNQALSADLPEDVRLKYEHTNAFVQEMIRCGRQRWAKTLRDSRNRIWM